MESLTIYPGGGYKSPTTVNATEMNGSAADAAMQILGSNNILNKEQTVQLGTDSQIVGGDVAEALSTQIKSGADLITGYKVGDNSSLLLTSMDGNTAELLQGAFGIIGNNFNNLAFLMAGRDANAPMADQSTVIEAQGKASALKEFFKTNTGRAAVAVAIIGLGYILFNSQKKGRK